MHLILTGATGTVGLAVLQHCLSNPSITQLSILSRRPVSLADGHPKANVIIHADYTTYPNDLLEKLKGASGIVWAQGISQTKVNKEEYIRITHDYPISAAKAMSSLSDRFNFVYVSGEGADPAEKGLQLFSRIKGRTEKDLLTLPNSSPSFSSLRIYNVRPGFVDSSISEVPLDRPQTLLERVGRRVLAPLFWVVPGLRIPSDKLGEYLVRLALGDGAPAKGGQGIEAGGRTIRNTAVRDAMDL